MKPVRIQRRRTKGFNLQAVSRAINGLDCISVTRPGKWGSPYDIRIFGRELAMAVFENTARGIWDPSPLVGQSDEICHLMYEAHHRWLKRLGEHPLTLMRSELRGHNVSCYCGALDVCHGDIYLKILAEEAA